MKRGVFLVFVLTLFGLYEPNFVYSQEDGFSLAPLYTEVEIVEEDAEKRMVMTLSNRTATDATFLVSTADFGSLDESGGIAFLGKSEDGDRRYGLASWLVLENEQITIPAGETEEVPVIIRNRESLSPGGHYGAVIFRVNGGNPADSGSPTVAVDSSFASLIFAKKRGGETYDLAYRDLRYSNKNFLGIPDVSSVRFQNAGNTHVVPRGRILVTDVFGRIVRKGIINEESARILPESFRGYTTSLRRVSPEALPGWYTVSLEYRYDGREETTVVPQEKIFPWGMNVLWVATMALLGGVVWQIYSKKRPKKATNPISRN